MSFPSGADQIRVEEALFLEPLRIEHGLHPWSKRPFHPLSYWHQKTRLGTLEKRRRCIAIKQVTKNDFTAVAAHLHRQRNAGGDVSHPMIEKRHACFEAVRHRRAIYLAEDVARQILN